MNRVLAAIICAALLCGCFGGKSVKRSGGSGSTRPYTVNGKTYYPLASAKGFVEEGIASWYGPGFHGKPTANGETFNQYAMTAAHKILPLGAQVRVTHLGTGRSILVRVNDRGPFVDDRVIDLARGAATRLGIMGSGTARVRVQAVGDLAAATPTGDIKGTYYIQIGSFSMKANASKLAQILAKAGQIGRIFYGNNKMWNVQAGPWPDSGAAQKMLPALKLIYPQAFVVGGN